MPETILLEREVTRLRHHLTDSTGRMILSCLPPSDLEAVRRMCAEHARRYRARAVELAAEGRPESITAQADATAANYDGWVRYCDSVTERRRQGMTAAPRVAQPHGLV